MSRRSHALLFLKVLKASVAAATASSMSSLPAAWTVAITSSVAGLTVSNYTEQVVSGPARTEQALRRCSHGAVAARTLVPLFASTNSLLMNSWVDRGSAPTSMGILMYEQLRGEREV
eukprot:COSAG04_NODE_545_length_12819_cov_3.351179_8_plen_117_part_00